MTISPIAIGIFVVPEDILFQNFDTFGLIQPAKTPINIARKIQRVRKRSRNFNLVFIIIN
jgi:hypothetical protein